MPYCAGALFTMTFCLSVRLSVRHKLMFCQNDANIATRQPTSLVFSLSKVMMKFHWGQPPLIRNWGGAKCTWGRKICDFRQLAISREKWCRVSVKLNKKVMCSTKRDIAGMSSLVVPASDLWHGFSWALQFWYAD